MAQGSSCAAQSGWRRQSSLRSSLLLPSPPGPGPRTSLWKASSFAEKLKRRRLKAASIRLSGFPVPQLHETRAGSRTAARGDAMLSSPRLWMTCRTCAGLENSSRNQIRSEPKASDVVAERFHLSSISTCASSLKGTDHVTALALRSANPVLQRGMGWAALNLGHEFRAWIA